MLRRTTPRKVGDYVKHRDTGEIGRILEICEDGRILVIWGCEIPEGLEKATFVEMTTNH